MGEVSLGGACGPFLSAQAQEKPTSLGSTAHSETPGLSLPGHHGSSGRLAQTLAPNGGGGREAPACPGPRA